MLWISSPSALPKDRVMIWIRRQYLWRDPWSISSRWCCCCLPVYACRKRRIDMNFQSHWASKEAFFLGGFSSNFAWFYQRRWQLFVTNFLFVLSAAWCILFLTMTDWSFGTTQRTTEPHHADMNKTSKKIARCSSYWSHENLTFLERLWYRCHGWSWKCPRKSFCSHWIHSQPQLHAHQSHTHKHIDTLCRAFFTSTPPHFSSAAILH